MFKTTKNEVRAKLKMISRLAEIAHELADSINPTDCTDDENLLFDELDRLRSDETYADDVWNEIKDYFESAEEGNEMVVPDIGVQINARLAVMVRYPVDGGYLVAETDTSDYDTRQIWLGYDPDNGGAFDLALAEVKKGELARLDYKEEDNKDIDLYIWSDVTSEDWQTKYALKYDDIIKED